MTWLTPTDIVVVTGGARGLGESVLKQFAQKGCQTVSLDVASPETDKKETVIGVESQESSTSSPSEEELKPTLSIICDVRNVEDLKKARDEIFAKFNRHPSVLVLNAAIRRPLNSIAESTYEDLHATIDVNINGVFNCLRTFLPDFISNERGFIVTVASALGIVVPKGLGSYGASKAALIGLQESLRQEVHDYKNIHTLLVCPGQLDTEMFSDVTTPSEWLAPIVTTKKLAAKIVKRVSKAKTSTVYSPPYVRYLSLLNAVPVSWARAARKLSGVDKVYDDIVAQRYQEEHANSDNDNDGSSPDIADVELSQEESDILTSSEALPEAQRSKTNPNEMTTPLSSIEAVVQTDIKNDEIAKAFPSIKRSITNQDL